MKNWNVIYRMETKENDSPSNVVINFKKHSPKMKIYSNQKVFKDTSIISKEVLIQYAYKWFKKRLRNLDFKMHGCLKELSLAKQPVVHKNE